MGLHKGRGLFSAVNRAESLCLLDEKKKRKNTKLHVDRLLFITKKNDMTFTLLASHYINCIIIYTAVVFVLQTTGVGLLMKCVNVPETNDSVVSLVFVSSSSSSSSLYQQPYWTKISPIIETV